ncbi:hypothetical protein Q4595_23585, partial [Wenyingzhuangia sp. 1_MG-2023]|nr:hypothetical protein [Wenyingzhuangia sp. 1_MG-2023]
VSGGGILAGELALPLLFQCLATGVGGRVVLSLLKIVQYLGGSVGFGHWQAMKERVSLLQYRVVFRFRGSQLAGLMQQSAGLDQRRVIVSNGGIKQGVGEGASAQALG